MYLRTSSYRVQFAAAKVVSRTQTKINCSGPLKNLETFNEIHH
jgi:hypothetical protein